MSERKIIDIHCHMLYGVDDGARKLEESIAMLDVAAAQSVKVICLTPHYRRGMFKYSKDIIDEHFDVLEPYAAERGIRLLKGCEYHVNSEITDCFDDGITYTLNSSEYVLAEFKYEAEEKYIFEQCKHLLRHGYHPVVAHIERYQAFYKNPWLAEDLRRQGAKLQVNANAVIGADGFKAKRLVNKFIKAGLVDLIGSDSHDVADRKSRLDKCFDYIEKKYGFDTADKLMYENAAVILGINS